MTTTTTTRFVVKSAIGRFLVRVQEYAPELSKLVTVATTWQDVQEWNSLEDGIPYFSDWFTEEEIDQLILDGIITHGFGEAEMIPVTERMHKMEIYSTISDLSKDANGFRHRLNVDDYSIAQLEELRDYYSKEVVASIEREREMDAIEDHCREMDRIHDEMEDAINPDKEVFWKDGCWQDPSKAYRTLRNVWGKW